MMSVMENVVLEGPPRTLYVQPFANARAVELLSLYNAIKKRKAATEEHQEGDTNDKKSIPHHLRRRTASYHCRHRPLPWLYKQKKNKNILMGTVPSSALHPNKKSRVQKGIKETVEIAPDILPKGEQSCKKKGICRSLRRLIDFKPGGSLRGSNGIRRLSSHIWHAKRFCMEKKWGYYLPVGRPGRGRGSRSVLRWSNTAALLQDTSFHNAIQIHGDEGKLLQILQLMFETSEIRNSNDDGEKPEISGEYFTTAFLHHGMAPYKQIAPVFLLWKPVIFAGCMQTDQSRRDLWIWVHAAAFEEAFEALQSVCRLLNESVSPEVICCFSRREDLGMLDLIGQRSFEILQKVLFPLIRDENGEIERFCELSEVIKLEETIGKQVVFMEVPDPRLNQSERSLVLNSFSSSRTEGKCISSPKGLSCPDEKMTRKSGTSGCNVVAIDALWKCMDRIHRFPLKEKFLSRMRHVDRLAAFGLLESTTESSKNSLISKSVCDRFVCPIMLLKHDGKKPSACGWSIILPFNWISAFWVPLVFAGGHVIGMRERHWLHTDAGSPSFPFDFPDTSAYLQLMSSMKGVDGLLPSRKHIEDHSAFYGTVCEPSLTHEANESETCVNAIPSCNSFVARTAKALMAYLHAIHQPSLLLFPTQMQRTEKFKTCATRLFDGTVSWYPKSRRENQNTSIENVCLVRVLIQPCDKGIAEVGASLYAPTSEDYDFWSHVQGRQNSTPGCKRDKLRESVGFVTSMAPYGSKNRISVAFGSAVALGLIRGKQWVETPWCKRSGIFLMFRNKNSNTFRPAFASVAIEEKPDEMHGLCKSDMKSVELEELNEIADHQQNDKNIVALCAIQTIAKYATPIVFNYARCKPNASRTFLH